MPDVTGPHSNGDYWQARWTTDDGKRHARSLGAKAKVTKREAKRLVRELQREIDAHPDTVPIQFRTVAALRERHAETFEGSDGTRKVHGDTWGRLVAFLGSTKKVRSVTAADGTDWSRSMDDLAEATRCIHHRNARAFWNLAVREGWATVNPFEHLRSSAPTSGDRPWANITAEQVERLIEACPSSEWRALVGLCAYAGLRRGECFRLAWDDVLWDKNRLVVTNQKTASTSGRPTRETLLSVELERILLDHREQSSGPMVLSIPENSGNLSRDMAKVMKRAGVQWKDRFKTLRKWRRMMWEQVYPAPVVCHWMGHSARVGHDHYSAVPEGLYERRPDPTPARPRQGGDDPAAQDSDSRAGGGAVAGAHRTGPGTHGA